MYVAAENGDYIFDNLSGEHVLTTPGTGDYAMGVYHGDADLSITVKDDGSWTAKSNGVDVTAALSSVVTISTIADVRERQMVDTAEVDLAALESSGFFPNNGLLYLGAYGGIPLQKTKGFVLKNGAELGGALTTVTQDSLYIQGDFNTTNKKPAAVIGDTVNLLSNAWDNSKLLSDSRSHNDAEDTTYNMAIVSGSMKPRPGVNLGELNNLVRMHEDWRGRDCVIKGSFVALWEPVNTDSGINSAAYYAPRRLWSYDTSFLQVDELPPYTPCYLEINRVATW